MPPKRKAAKQVEAVEEVPDQVEEISSSKKGKQASDAGDVEEVPVKETRVRPKRGEKKEEVVTEDVPKETSKKADKTKKRAKEVPPQNGHVEADSQEEIAPEEEPKKKKSKEEKSKDKKSKDKSEKASSSKKSKEKTKEEKPKKEKAASKNDKDSEKPEKEKAAAKTDKAEKPEKEEKPKRGRAKKEKSEEPEEDVKASKEKSGTLMNKTASSWDKIDFSCSAKNSKGETYNLRISSWNVGGVKSWIKKDCHQYLQAENPDILCLQETKCNESKLPDEITEMTDYKQYFLGSEKEGYAGVGLLTKVEPINVTYGINIPEQDEDGRCITAEYEDYYVVNVYVPNSGRGLVTLPKRLKWNKVFKDYIKTLDKKKPVIICGDMNVSHNEIDLARPKSNTKNAGFTPEEREGMTDFLGDGFVDSFRELYPDKPDTYTFWSYMGNARSKNVGWRLDYFIVSERIKDTICDNVMRTEVYGSDHCPITLFLNI